jgi:hypothetical protein
MCVCVYVCSSITLERLEQFQPNLVHIWLHIYILYNIYLNWLHVCLLVCIDFCYCQLRFCWRGAPSLMKGQISRLQLLLALASLIILRPESPESRDNSLLIQIRDSPAWKAMSPCLYPPETRWPSYTPRHWDPFPPPSSDSQGYGGVIRTSLQAGTQSRSYFQIGILPEFSPSWREAPWSSRPEFFLLCKLTFAFQVLMKLIWRECGFVS